MLKWLNNLNDDKSNLIIYSFQFKSLERRLQPIFSVNHNFKNLWTWRFGIKSTFAIKSTALKARRRNLSGCYLEHCGMTQLHKEDWTLSMPKVLFVTHRSFMEIDPNSYQGKHEASLQVWWREANWLCAFWPCVSHSCCHPTCLMGLYGVRSWQRKASWLLCQIVLITLGTIKRILYVLVHILQTRDGKILE